MFRIWFNNFFNTQHPFWRVLAISLIVAGLLIGVVYMIELGYKYTPFGENVDITKTGAVGDFIAGVVGTVFALAGFIMVYLTYRDQVRANERDKIEQRFFTLLQIHVDNSNNINYQNPYNAQRIN
jgi:hypothetical protein